MKNSAKIKMIYPLTPLQEGMLYHHLADNDDTSYHLQTSFWVHQEINLEKIEASLALLAMKHEVLKTAIVIPKATGKSWQVIVENRKIELNYEEKLAENELSYLENVKQADLKRGFDLQKDSLIRLKIIRFSQGRYLFMFSSHHIIMDGWCMSMIFNDFIHFYAEIMNETSPKHLKETIQQENYQKASFKEYIEWLEMQDKFEGLHFWETLLSDYEGPAQISTMNVPSPSESQMERLRIEIPEQVSQSLNQLANEYKITLSNILEMTWGIVLQKYNGSEDVVFGKVVSGRSANIKGIEKIVGLFINTIPMRIKNNQQTIISDLLKSTWEQSVKANSYDYCSLAEIQSNNSLGSQLIQTLFAFENYYVGVDQPSSIQKVVEVEMDSAREQTNYAVSMSTSYNHKNIYCDLMFDPNEHMISEMQRVLDCMGQLLTEIAENPNKKIAELSGITESEKQLILNDFNQTDVDYDQSKTIIDLLSEKVKAHPNLIAISYLDRRITYEQFDEMTNSLAYKLSQMGIGTNDFVALICDRGIEMIASIFAIIKSGAAFVPISPAYPEERTQYILQNCQPKAILVSDSQYTKNDSCPVINVSEKEIWEGESKITTTHLSPHSLAYLIYTSGTTGLPKGVMVEHRGVVSMSQYLKKLYDVSTDDQVLQFANYVFDASIWEMTLALLNGASLVIAPQETIEDIQLFETFLKKEQITLALLPPQYSVQVDVSCLKIFTTGGSQSNEEVIKKASSRYINAYGPTETTVLATHWEYQEGTEVPKNIPIGKPIDNTKIYLLNGDNLCGIGMPGEICITGVGVARGYLNQPNLTDQKFVVNPFGSGRMYRSGDLARWLPDGTIEYLGRNDEQVKIRGFRIELGEIENVLRKIDSVKDAVAIVKQSENGENNIWVYYTAIKNLDRKYIKTILSETLPNYMIPSYMMQIEAIPLTASGKLDKQKLPLITTIKRDVPFKPRNQTEKALSEIFCEVLECEKVGIKDNFFEIGGHSIRAIRLINRIEAETGAKISVKELFIHPTIEQLGQLITNEVMEEYQAIPFAKNKLVYSMSKTQKRMYILSLVSDHQTVYNMPQCFKVEGGLDTEKLFTAFETVIARHEALRTGFFIEQGEPVQKIYPNVATDTEVIKETEFDLRQEIKFMIQPFDLASGNLVRMKVIKGNTYDIWFVDMHHIAGDGMSMNIFLNEVLALYHGQPVAQLTKQYKDYSEWMLLRDLTVQEQYWHQEFSDVPEVLNMPLDNQRPVNQQFEGARIHQVFDNQLVSNIKNLAKEKNVTEYMILLSAVMILLAKYSRQEDLVIGSPVSGRVHQDTEQMMGVFVNTLAMRGKPEKQKCYDDFLEEIKETCLNAYDHQEYSFDELIENLAIHRDVSRNPLFDVMLVLQNNESGNINMLNQTFSSVEVDFSVAKFDLTFNVYEMADQYQVTLEYCSSLFKLETIEGLLSHFEYILKQITENPKQQIKSIKTASKDEQNSIVSVFNQSSKVKDQCKTVAELFEQQVLNTPNNIAVCFEGISITYDDLNKRANAVANKLIAEGIQADDYVVVLAQRSIEMIVAIYGVIKSGAAYIPLDSSYPKERIADIIADCKPKAAVIYESAIDLDTPIIDLKQPIINANEKNPIRFNQPDSLLYVIYTSGTTGKSKGVMVTNQGVVNLRNYFIETLGVTEEDVILQFANIIFDGSVWEMNMALLLGATLVVVNDEQRKDVDAFSKLAFEKKVTVAALPPIFYMNVVNFHPRILITAGSEASTEMVKAVVKDSTYVNSYGPSECTVAATHWSPERKQTIPYHIPIGQPISNVQVYIIEDNNLCGFGVPGEIHIAGAGVAKGYINQSELTNKRFISNPFGNGLLYRTGDLGRWTNEGTIEFLGRIDQQEKIRGFRVELNEVENTMRTIEQVRDAAVITRKIGGEKEIHAYYVSNGKVAIEEVKEKLELKLPSYMIPVAFMELENIPLTKNGKLNEAKLPEIQHISKNEYIAPTNAQEVCICQAFEEVLVVEKIGIKDNFFELGGDSIKAIRVVSKVREQGYNITVRDIMQQHCAKEIAKVCLVATDYGYEQGEVNGKIPDTPIIRQFKSWNLKKPSFFNQAMMIKIKLNKDEEIKKALTKILMHHDMLRAVYRNNQLEILSMSESPLFNYEYYDVTKKDNPEQYVEQCCTKIQSSINLEKGPLVQVAVFKTIMGNYMMLAVHHLVIDGVSFRIIIEDFQKVQESLLQGREIYLEEKTASYKEWSEALIEYQLINADSPEKVYWDKIIKEVEASNLQLSDEQSEKGEGNFDSLSFSLNDGETQTLIRETNHAFHTEINDLLLAALANAVKDLTGQEKVSVGMEGHGREQIHKEILIDRTVGWFTSSYPVIVTANDELRTNIITNKERLRQIPRKGLGYGLLIEEKEQIDPTIYFNYLGVIEASSALEPKQDLQLSTGLSVAKENHLPGGVNFNGSVNQDQLVFILTYDANRYSEETMQRLIEAYKVRLVEIINFCKQQKSEKTASDYSANQLTTMELTTILEEAQDIDDIYSLTGLQEGLFFHNELSSDSTSYMLQNVYNLSGEVNIDHLKQALALLVEKHDVLRTAIYNIGSAQTIRQAILSGRKPAFSSHNLEDKPSFEQKKIIKEVVSSDLNKGFDLQNDPLMRVTYIRLGPITHKLIWSFHHIIVDGWCLSIIFGDFLTYYYQLQKGISEKQLFKEIKKEKTLKSNYSDYLTWLNQQNKEQALMYWKNLLEDYEGAAMISPMTQPEKQEDQMARVRISWEKELSSKTMTLAKNLNVTLNTVLETLWGLTLSHYSACNDVVFGKVTSGRDAKIDGIEEVVGLFANTIPVRFRYDKQTTIKELVENIQTQAGKSGEFGYVALTEIQEEVARGSEWIKTLFVFENYYVNEKQLQPEDYPLGIQMETAREETNYALTVSMSSDGTHINCDIMFNPNEFIQAEVNQMIEHMKMILISVTENIDQKVVQLDRVTKSDKELILNTFNDTECNYPKEKSIATVLTEQMNKNPEHTALICHDSNGTQEWTYKKLEQKTKAIASKLLASGIKSGDYVAILAEKSPEMIAAICGTLFAGAVYVPIEPTYPKERVQFILDDCQPTAILVGDIDEKQRQEISYYDKMIIDLNKSTTWLLNEATEFQTHSNGNQLAYLIYTSGTTGNPKGTMIENKSVLRLIKNQNFIELNEETTILQTGSMAFDAATFEIWGSLLNGGKLVLVHQEILFDYQKLKNCIKEFQVNTMWLTSTLFNQLLDLNSAMFDSLNYLLIGGEKLSDKHVRLFKAQKNSVKLINGYGPTENTTFTTTYCIPETFSSIPIGKCIANSEVYIMQEKKLCGIGIPGELCIAGDGLARGYLNNGDLTNKKFEKDSTGKTIYRSGDMARWLPDGNIEYLGRIDTQVKIRGYRVELEEITTVLRANHCIKDAAVVLRKDQTDSNYISAYYTVNSPIELNQIKQYLHAKLPEYLIPASFSQLDTLPITSNGKLDKKALPLIALDDLRKYVAPKTETEALVAGIFADIVELEKVSRLDNFFEIGGHSLRAIKLINLVDQKLQRKLSLQDIFENPTVELLSEKLDGLSKTTYMQIPKATNRKYYPMSSSQKRIFLLYQIDEQNTVYNMPQSIKLLGSTDIERLKNAFEKIICRHEILRTAFQIIEGEAVQIVHEKVSPDFEYVEDQIDINEEKSIMSSFIQPFNLEQAQTVRMRVIKKQDYSLLFFDMHHIVGDGMSMGIFMNEFTHLYNEKQLPVLTHQYKDYSEWMSQQNLAKQKNYWIKEFEDIPVLDFPIDKPRPQNRSYEGNVVYSHLSKELHQKIKKIALENEATEYIVILASLMILLAKYSRQEDIVVGSPVSGRTHKDTESMLGVFINTLAFRGKPQKEKTFDTFFKEMKKTCLKGFENQEYPFEALVEAVDAHKDMTRNPLFDVMLILQNNETAKLQLGNTEATGSELDYNTSKFDLTFNLHETVDQGYVIALEYCSALFKQESMERLLRHFNQVIEQVTAKPTEKIKNISVITEEEVQRIQRTFNHQPFDSDRVSTIIELLEKQVMKTPNKEAVFFENQVLTYKEFNEKVNVLAHKLRQQGIQPNDLVPIIAERSVEMVIGIYAILKAGGVYVPVDKDYPQERIEYILQECQPKTIVMYHAPELVDYLTQLENIHLLDLANRQIWYGDKQNLPIINQSTDLSYVIYTSGTTGKPKGVMVTNKNVINLLEWMVYQYKLNEDDVLLQKTSYTFDVSVSELLLWPFFGGSLVILAPDAQRDPKIIFETIEKQKVTVINFVPTMLSAFLSAIKNEPTVKQMTASLRYCLSAGEALPKGIVTEFYQVIPENTVLSNLYGPSETTVYSSHFNCTKNQSEVLIGKPIGNVNLYILDCDNLCGIGVPGELCISGEGVSPGYLKNKELTEKYFVDHLFLKEKIYRTGDLARWRSDGTIEYLGRMDTQVKVRGFRIEISEIENALRRIKSLKDVAVIVKEDNSGENAIYAYLTSMEKLAFHKIKLELKNYLPDYMIPTYFMQLSEIPVTNNGKLDRRSLPNIVLKSVNAFKPAENEVQDALCQVFSEILMTEIGIQDGFFEMGGDSIKAIRSISKLRELGYEVTIKDILAKQTVEAISLVTKNSKINPYEQGEVSGVVLPTQMTRMFENWELVNLNYFNQAMMIPVFEANKQEIQKTLKALVLHHDILRGVYQAKEFTILKAEGQELYYFETHDFTNTKLSEVEIAEKIAEIGSDIQSKMDIEQGPLLRAGYFKTPTGNFLLISIHHLAVDGVSWRILIEDLTTSLKQLANSEPIVLPEKTASMIDWSNALVEYQKTNQLLAEKKYWDKISEESKHGQLIKNAKTNQFKVYQYETITQFLEEIPTKKLLTDSQKAFHTDTNDLLIAALALAINTVTDQTKITVALEGHGREEIHKEIQIDRTVGWFTSMYPIVLNAKKDIRNTIIDTKDRLRRIPNHGFGYGLLHSPEELQADVYFNYLGESNQQNTTNEITYSAGVPIDSRNRLPGNINFNSTVINGKLFVAISYDQQLFEKDIMEKLAIEYKEILLQLIDFCVSREVSEKTATDYTELMLTENDLETITSNYDEVEDIYGLTGLQEGMLFYNLQTNHSTSYVIQSVYNLKGKIQKDYVEKALYLLSKRHDVLRTAILHRSILQPYQVILKDRIIEYQEIEASEETTAELISRDLNRGFDLEKDSLVRVTLIKKQKDHYILVWSIHHIIIDGWCLSQIFSDFLHYYYELVNGRLYESLLEQIEEESRYSAKFSAYITWLKNQDKAEGLAYWKEYLTNYETAISIDPLQKTVANAKQMDRLAITLDELVVKSLKQLAALHNVTMNTVTEVIWGLVLQNYNNVDDVVFGKVVSGRDADIEGIEQMIGLFVNTIPVRITKKPHMTTEKLLKEVQNSATKSSSFDYCSLAEIQNQSSMGQELIKTLFVFENYHVDRTYLEEKESDLHISVEEAREQTNYALTISVNYTGETLQFDLMYNPNEYHKEDITRILKKIAFTAAELANNKQNLLEDHSYLTKEENKQIKEIFNDTKQELSHKTVIQLFEEQVEKTPDNVALIMGDQQLTYREFDQQTNALANYLIKMGIKPNDHVAIIAERSIEMLLGIFAIVKASAAYVPIDPTYPDERIDYMLNDCQPKAVLVYHYQLESQWPVVDLTVEENFSGDMNLPTMTANLDDSLYVIYTSGTTGNPKGVVNKQRGLVNLLSWLQKSYPIEPTDVMLFKTTYIFDVSISEIFWWSITGATLSILEPEAHKDPSLIAEKIAKDHVTHLNFAPAMLSMFNKTIGNRVNSVSQLKDLRYVFSAGEALNVEVVNQFYRLFDSVQHPKLINLYGPTEATIYVTHFECVEEMNRVPIGRPIMNTQLYIMADQKMCGIGEIGELYLAGEGIAKGYLNNQELTMSKFVDNPFAINEEKMYQTGDLARWLPDGTIEYLGRIDDQVKIRGFRIELGDIESALRKQAGIADVATIFKERGNSNKAIYAYITSKEKVDIKQLKISLNEILPLYMVPQYIMQLESIPITQNGKLDHKALPEIFIDTDTAYVAPRNETEGKLCDIYQNELNISKIGIADNLFELGGNSLIVIRIVGQATLQGINITIQNVYMYPTIEKLCDYLENDMDQPAKLEANDYEKYHELLNKTTSTEQKIIKVEKLGNVLLTGATGFLGIHIVEQLLHQNQTDTIYCLIRCVNNEHGERRLKSAFDYFFDGQYKELVGTKIKVVAGDLIDLELADKFPANIQTIIHAAANTKHFGFYKDFYAMNVRGTENIVNYAQKVNATLIYISTISVSELLHEDAPKIEFTEQDYYMDQILESPYMRSKFEAERVVYDAVLNGADAVIIRTGMLINRQRDLKAMKDYKSNSFLNSIKTIVKLGAVSDTIAQTPLLVSPVDEVAAGIVALAKHRVTDFCVFHLFQENSVSFKVFKKIFEERGFPIEVMGDESFAAFVSTEMKQNITDELYEIVATSKVEQVAKHSELKNELTTTFLSDIGFQWSELSEQFISGWVDYYDELNYWKD